ncbi:NAD-dependent epimerase/dehydratase family protein, partial [Candidatus Uhrbacteria bacterium]|nr:NAD-dependent epimerase/dehydratase family protein [Candidatus Uhrbacteria bacterium]
YLLSRGHQVTTYDILPFAYPERSMVTEVMGDIRDAQKLTESMMGAQVVIHTAAALPLYSQEDIRSTDIDGTRNVCEAVVKQGVDRLIHISSTAVYGIPDHHPLYETDALDGVGEYGKAKIAAEKICLELRANGVCTSVIRPKSFIGPERLGVFALFYDWAADGRGFPMIGSGNNRYQLLDVEDLCEAIYLCATLPQEKVNETFNIGAKDFRTMREDYQAVLDVAGFGKKIHPLPATPVIWALRFLEALHLSPLYKWVYETASMDSFVSLEKAERMLGYTPRFSNQQALIRNFRWYLEHRREFAHARGVTHRVPWRQGLLSCFKLFF